MLYVKPYPCTGVETRVAGFGDTHTLDYVDDWNYISYYKDLVEGIMSQPGAVDGVSVRAAPYDFRYSPPSSQSKLFFDKSVFEGVRSTFWLLFCDTLLFADCGQQIKNQNKRFSHFTF